MHKLNINSNGKNKEIKLDDFELQGVKEYEVKSSDTGVTELKLKILVKDSKIEI